MSKSKLAIFVFAGFVMVAAAIVELKFLNIFESRHIAAQPVTDEALAGQIAANKLIMDTAVSLLKSGDIVLRRGLGADSYMLAEMNRKDKTYSHCGIVMIEGGYPFVYHSIGGEDNPDERLRRDSAVFFFSPLHNTHAAIVRYKFSEANISKLGEVVRQYYRTKPKFDLKFDLQTEDVLYCSEFVYRSVSQTMADTAYIHTSDLFGHRFVGIDDLFLNEHANVVWQTKFK